MDGQEHIGDFPRIPEKFVRDGKPWQCEYFVIPRPELTNGSRVMLYLKVPGSEEPCNP